MTLVKFLFPIYNLIYIWILSDCVVARSYYRSGYYRSSRSYYYNYYYNSSSTGSGWIVGAAIGGVLGGIFLIIIIYAIIRKCIVTYKKPTFQVKPNTRAQIIIPPTRTTSTGRQPAQNTIPMTSRGTYQNPGYTNSFQYNPPQPQPYSQQPYSAPQYSPQLYPSQPYPPDLPVGYDPPAYPPPQQMPPPPVYSVHDTTGQNDSRTDGILSPPPSYSDSVTTRTGHM